jgi:hypothetical protein
MRVLVHGTDSAGFERELDQHQLIGVKKHPPPVAPSEIGPGAGACA